MKKTNCIVCKAIVPDIEGPVSSQKYLPQSPGCWRMYTEVLAREYGEWNYPDIHRLTVDCYALHHPTLSKDEKSAQSIAIHLIGARLTLENNIPSKQITLKLNEIANQNKGNFKWVPPPERWGRLTIVDIHKAKDLNNHIRLVKLWAEELLFSWRHHYILGENFNI